MADVDRWSNFFVAEAGASAALAGLLFVAVSINLQRILQFQHLPLRAVEGLVALLSVLIVSTFGLVPGQGALALGLELAGVGVCVWAAQTAALRRTRGAPRYGWYRVRLLMNQLPSIPFVVAGVLLVAGVDPGAAIVWVVPGTILSFMNGIFSAWILLVEIQR